MPTVRSIYSESKWKSISLVGFALVTLSEYLGHRALCPAKTYAPRLIWAPSVRPLDNFGGLDFIRFPDFGDDSTRAVIDKLGAQPGEALTPERVEAMHEDLGRFISTTSYFVLGSYGEDERSRLEAVRDHLVTEATASHKDDDVGTKSSISPSSSPRNSSSR